MPFGFGKIKAIPVLQRTNKEQAMTHTHATSIQRL